jgi:hypothetical protein
MTVHIRPLGLPLLLGACLVSGACSETAGTGALLEAVADTVDGVPSLTYPERGATALAWSLDTAAVIGGFEARGEDYQFDRVGPADLAGNARGDLFLIDQMGNRVLGYDSSGTFIGSWGREGEGPGELQMPIGLGLGRADTLWVVDGGNQRITLLPSDSEAEPGSIPFPPGGTSRMGGRVAPSPEGGYGVLAMFTFRPGEEEWPPRPLVLLERDGTVTDTVWQAPAPKFDRVEIENGGRVMVMLVQQTFAPMFVWDRYSDGDFAVVDGPAYDVRIVSPEGEERLRIGREPAPRVTTPEDQERARDRAREQSTEADFPGAEEMLEKQLDAMTFADVIPRITGLGIDAKDRLWVGVSTETPGETGRIDVYDRDGQLLGEIRDPGFFPALFYGPDLAVDLTTDDLDVQQVVVYRIDEGEGGAGS